MTGDLKELVRSMDPAQRYAFMVQAGILTVAQARRALGIPTVPEARRMLMGL